MILLPTIRDTEFLPGTLDGGTTRPMLVMGEDGREYVLKLLVKQMRSKGAMLLRK